MKTIKFRAWNGSHMLEWDWLVGMGMVSYVLTGDRGKHEVMQFTGLHDKNGKEVYEGDILRLDGNDCLDPKYRDLIHVVWDERGLQWFAESPTEGNDALYVFFTERAEVIGNIYENPDLLK